ncbi:hypothetical protein COLO4_06600 [Corchorus olitorius]|uniref:SAM dependent carboxyl methyltransferase n=1 Tax=Corchorus olitorius TaxID=93759 RepID=A0A1R3KMK2_9ROSI|nr:hypothetical protein COLO4_06600 [Corchorus olitorius]
MAKANIVLCMNAADNYQTSYANNSLLQVPSGVENNYRNIYMAKSSPPNVIKAYSEQFEKDFSNFLRSRSEELVAGGGMLLTLIGRSITNPTNKCCFYIWDLLAISLLQLVAEGLVEESEVDSFNMPFYNPCEEEVKEIVEKEGSFDLDKLEIFQANWDFEDDFSNKNFVFDKHKSGQNVADCVRAVAEPILASHFGKTIMDDLFKRYANNVADHLSVEKTKYINVTKFGSHPLSTAPHSPYL